MGIKPGSKRKSEDGSPDKRQRVRPENQKEHPDLKRHKTQTRSIGGGKMIGAI